MCVFVCAGTKSMMDTMVEATGKGVLTVSATYLFTYLVHVHTHASISESVVYGRDWINDMVETGATMWSFVLTIFVKNSLQHY